jgi:magnesium transporter
MTHGHKKRRRLFHRRRYAPGAAPGTLVIPPGARPSALTVFAYHGDRCFEVHPEKVAELRELREKYPVIWVNVDGLGDLAMLKELAGVFHLHPLAMEDVVNMHQRPKLDEFPDCLFIVMRMLTRNEVLSEEQVSIFIGRNFVLTFQENLPGDSFGPVRQRLRERGPLTSRGPDYLAYRLIDAIIDSYFPLLEQYGELLEGLEEEVLVTLNRDTLLRVHAVRHELLTIRRAIWPAREAINSLVRDRTPLIQDETRLFFRDAYDHTVQLMDLLETYREVGSDMRDLYMSSASNRLNEIMKVLTIISTIFIPLTFIAGVYGMNFDWQDGKNPYNMPELRWYWGYPFVLLVMVVIAVSLLLFFRRKGWIGRAPSRQRANWKEGGRTSADRRE